MPAFGSICRICYMFSYHITKFQHIKSHIFKHKILKFLYRYWFIIIFHRKQFISKIRRKQKSFVFSRFCHPVFRSNATSRGQTLAVPMKTKQQQTFDQNPRVSYTIHKIHACIYIFAGNLSIRFRKKSNFFIGISPYYGYTIHTNYQPYSISSVLQCGFSRHILKITTVFDRKTFQHKSI